MNRIPIVTGAVLAVLPSIAAAEDRRSDFFAGVEVFGGFASGSSSTTNGGGNLPVFRGNGIVRNVDFGSTVGVGGYVGYHIDRNWSLYLSYRYVGGDISWRADYPGLGVSSRFSGDAFSNVLMGNVSYGYHLSEETSLILKAGLGLLLNTLSDVTERDQASGLFAADLADNTEVSPAAQLGLGIQHALTPSVSVGLNVSISYAGSFKTGDKRTGNLGVTEINPYEIENVWRGDLGGSMEIKF